MKVQPNPETWPLEDFPDPNPYFPPPPRKVPGWPLWVSGPLIPLAGAGVIYGIRDGNAIFQDYFILPVIGCFLLFCIVLGSFFLKLGRWPWRNAAILPALVEWGASGAPSKQSSGCTALLLPPPLGLIVDLLARFTSDREGDSFQIRFVRRGQSYRRWLKAGEHWGQFSTDRTIWVARTWTGRVFALPGAGPDDLAFTAPNAFVQAWLKDAIAAAEQHQDSALETDLRQAAKANTRAMKRAGRG